MESEIATAIKMLLGMASGALVMKSTSRTAHMADYHETCANTYYTSAWIVAGTPPRCEAWPGFATWSARETLKRAA